MKTEFGQNWEKDIFYLLLVDKPKISVIIPVRNEADKIEHCLRAVFSQSLKPYEVIVVDGHSTDMTVEKARKFSVKILYEDSHNRAGGCQIGLESATGDYVSFIDADCIPEKNWLVKLVREFDDGIAGVAGDFTYLGEGLWVKSINLTLTTFLSGTNQKRLKIKSFVKSIGIGSPIGMCRRKDLLEVGGFNKSLTGAEDLELDSRLLTIGKILFIPDAVMLHSHTDSLKDFSKKMYNYGGWRRESKVWGPQFIVQLLLPLLLLSLVLTPWILSCAFLLYLTSIAMIGVRFAIQEKNIRYLISIPVVYIVEHFFFTLGFWKETIRPRKKSAS